MKIHPSGISNRHCATFAFTLTHSIWKNRDCSQSTFIIVLLIRMTAVHFKTLKLSSSYGSSSHLQKQVNENVYAKIHYGRTKGVLLESASIILNLGTGPLLQWCSGREAAAAAAAAKAAELSCALDFLQQPQPQPQQHGQWWQQ